MVSHGDDSSSIDLDFTDLLFLPIAPQVCAFPSRKPRPTTPAQCGMNDSIPSELFGNCSFGLFLALFLIPWTMLYLGAGMDCLQDQVGCLDP